MSAHFKKNLIQTIIAIGIFLILALIFTYPSLQGKVLNQHDTLSWKAMSWEAREYYEATGETQLWTNSMFGGMTTYTTYMTGIPQAMYSIQETIQQILPSPAYFLFFAMLGFFILLSSLNTNCWVAVIGAITYAFAAYNLQIMAAGHNTKMLSVAFMPIAVAGMISLYRGKYITGSMMALAGLALTIQQGMYQVVYYLGIILILLGVAYFVKAVQRKKWKRFFMATAIMLACGLLSISMNYLYVKLTKEYGDLTMRGGKSELTINKSAEDKNKKGGLDKGYAFRWSQGIGETFTLFVPNLYGGGPVYEDGQMVSYEYWGDQPMTSGPFYFGVITMLLLILSLFFIRNNIKWWLFGIGMLGIIMSWGRNFSAFNEFLFDTLPLYNSFRTPTMAMVITGLSFGTLAFWALSEFLKGTYTEKERWDALKKAVIITGVITLFSGLGSGMLTDYKVTKDGVRYKEFAPRVLAQKPTASPAEIEQIFDANINRPEALEMRSDMATKDGMRSLFFLLAAAVLLWFFTKSKLKKEHTIAALGLLFLLDVVTLGWRYLKDDENFYVEQDVYDAQFAPRPVDLQVKADPDPYYRVFDLSTDLFNDAMPAVHHKLVGGYSPVKLESFQDLIDIHLRQGGASNPAVLDMLNTKYLIGQSQNNQLVAERRPTAAGNAWFVQEIKQVQNADEEMLALSAANPMDSSAGTTSFEPKKTAVIQAKELAGKNIPLTFTKDSAAQITLKKYSLNYLDFESSNQADGFAVFSDIYYPLGWKAYVNGKESPIIKTNYLLRGLYLPKGNNQIRFEFKPDTYVKYKWVPTVSSYLILFLLVGLGFIAIKNQMQLPEESKLEKE